jgi:nucleosome binding factor SPN SPT16 subunit
MTALFENELSDVLLVFTDQKVIILAAVKKAKIAQELADKLPDSFGRKLEVLTRDKGDKDAANFAKVIDSIKGSKKGTKVGTFSKEKNSGAFAKAWEEALEQSKLEVADIQNGISDFLAIKSSAQQQAVRKSAQVNTQAFKNTLLAKILDIVDQEDKKYLMAKLSEEVEGKIDKIAKENGADVDDVDLAWAPVIQSGGTYDLKYSAQTSEKGFLHIPDTGVPAIHVAAITLR